MGCVLVYFVLVIGGMMIKLQLNNAVGDGMFLFSMVCNSGIHHL